MSLSTVAQISFSLPASDRISALVSAVDPKPGTHSTSIRSWTPQFRDLTYPLHFNAAPIQLFPVPPVRVKISLSPFRVPQDIYVGIGLIFASRLRTKKLHLNEIIPQSCSTDSFEVGPKEFIDRKPLLSR
jgi:hypothetical protein